MWRLIAMLIAGVTLGLAVAMAFAWFVQRRTKNAGWADVVWSFSLGVAGAVYALFPLHGEMLAARNWLVAAAVVAWSLRLGLHIAGRTVHGAEDARYAQFRADWGTEFQRRMFWFLQIQAAAAALLAISILLASHNPRPLSLMDFTALAVLLVAIAGEAAADRQLRQFRSASRHRNDICDVGLWGWSRHPNYFFESLGWIAYPLLAIDPLGGYPLGWFALSGPAFMYVLLVYVSGIPPLEEQMLRSRGEAFRAYQRRVSAFLPLPPGRSK